MAKNLTIFFPHPILKALQQHKNGGKKGEKNITGKYLSVVHWGEDKEKCGYLIGKYVFPMPILLVSPILLQEKNWIRMTVIFSCLFVTKFSLTWLELEFHLIPWAGCCFLESSKLLNNLSLEVFFDTVTRASVSWCFLIWILNITKNCWCFLKE